MTDTHKELSILDTLKLALEALNTWCRGFPDLVSNEDRKSIAAIKEALMSQSDGTQPEQEPIGYLWPTGMHPEFRYFQQKLNGADGTPVYFAPPQRKPLTDEQREEIAKGWRGRNWTVGDIIDAVEAAHGIKGDA